MDVGFVLLAAVGVLSSVSAECPADKVALRGGLCMPYASDGDAMKHTPSINDTVAVSSGSFISPIIFLARFSSNPTSPPPLSIA